MDIEFLDAIDGRRKYCQIKSGPNTINHDDITTIFNHFTAIKNLARTNRMTDFNPLFDCIIGVFYGTEDELNASYRTIARDYPVFIGQNFWHRLTGDKNFYFDLINAFAEVAVEMDSTELINNVLQELTQQIRDAEL
ncbi:PmeII family type II restriction endonuclease [Tissierella praeacuta]|uniref:PmeII family type II restriction endonuclease n=1 Tax=Tissierella praeacuta TaxID=43131 RepID=UPI0028AB93BF|nr:PmeII family type II restriction endonuclease [Tissierella praeacuta]